MASLQKYSVRPLANNMHLAMLSVVLCILSAFPFEAWFSASLTWRLTPAKLQNGFQWRTLYRHLSETHGRDNEITSQSRVKVFQIFCRLNLVLQRN